MTGPESETGTESGSGSESESDPRGDPAGETPPTPVGVRVRGIYATALTRLFAAADGFAVVQPSTPIAERFDAAFAGEPADVSIETTRDRQGVSISGRPEGVAAVASELDGVGIDAFRWSDATPTGAVFDAAVVDTRGDGAEVDLGDGFDGRGYLPFDAVDGSVDDGDRYRVQVREATPPWDDDLPRVAPTLAVESDRCTVSRDRSGVSAAGRGERARELVGLTDLLSASVPDGWGLRWHRNAHDADLDALDAALDRVADRAETLDDALTAAGDVGEPRRLAAQRSTAWCWFGRESRFALDAHRRAVAPTMAGHHRIKAADRAASTAVDFVEAVCGSAGADGNVSRDGGDESGSTDGEGGGVRGDVDGDGGGGGADGDGESGSGDGDFPFEAVFNRFGPREGDRIELGHGKPDGRALSLGTGEVTRVDADGSLTLRRQLRGGGTYDALETPKEAGDVAVTKLREGRWWYATTYEGADGTAKGTYVNVCTPVECFPDGVRYVDLYVDVIRRPDGTVATVDEDELSEAVEAGLVADDLANKARRVAAAVERALSE